MNQNHLSTAEVLTYRENIGSTGSIRIGRHVLVCKECRSKLPTVTPDEFRACVSSSNLILTTERSLPSLIDITHSPRLWSVARITAFAGLAILLLAGVYFVGVHRSNISDDTVAQNEDNSIGTRFDSIGEEPVSVPASSEKQPSESVSTKSASKSNPKSLSIEPDANSFANRLNVSGNESSKNRKAGDSPRKIDVDRNPAVSKIRGLASRCSGAGQFELEFKSIEKSHVLKWKKFPKAVKYHLYISDDEEILVDEYETREQTSYVLKKQLDEGKVYKWKVVIELENGGTLVGVSQIFTSKVVQQRQKGSVKRLNADIRCSSIN